LNLKHWPLSKYSIYDSDGQCEFEHEEMKTHGNYFRRCV